MTKLIATAESEVYQRDNKACRCDWIISDFLLCKQVARQRNAGPQEYAAATWKVAGAMLSPPAMSSTETLFRLPRIPLRLGEAILRIDSPEQTVVVPAAAGNVVGEAAGSAIERGQTRSAAQNEETLSSFHAENLVDQLSEWSLLLDRRESDLMQWQESLQRAERRLRQSHRMVQRSFIEA